MDFVFDYENITLEEIDSYGHYDFICDGDDKKVKVIRSDENEDC